MKMTPLFVVVFVALISSSGNLKAACYRGDSRVLECIARDIEGLKPEFPQLRDFSVLKNFDASRPSIDYSFHTHEPKRMGGWTAGVPNPDEDGVWFYIDIHDPDSTAQIHTQPVTEPICLGEKRVTFLSLEGDGTKSMADAIWKILERYGAKRCER